VRRRSRGARASAGKPGRRPPGPTTWRSATRHRYDPDAVEPAGKVWVHWLVWNVDPGRTTIPEGWTPSGAVEGTLDLSAGAERRALGAAMEGAVRARTQLEGTYPP
jgi:phosphatidylethanolamine-binding protein (PEBP) family uncharacterized protein